MKNGEKIISDLIAKSAYKGEFEKKLLEILENVPGSKEVLETYKKALFYEISQNPDYLNLPDEEKEEKVDSKGCPFPDHKGYLSVWLSLSPDMREEFKNNIKITDDGKIEVVQMKKKFSLLSSSNSSKRIFDGDHVDGTGNKGISGITYFGPNVVAQECENQNLKYFKEESEINQFIDMFPGTNQKEKVNNFVKLFAKPRTGFLDKRSGWKRSEGLNGNSYGVDPLGYLKLSIRDGDKKGYEVCRSQGRSVLIFCEWKDTNYYPFLCYEDVE